MKPLYKALSIKNKIEIINADSINDAIKKAWVDDKYRFSLNSELIDVNNRFRIFEYQKSIYIIKKSSTLDAESELDLAIKADEHLKNIKVDEYTLKVIVPIVKVIEKEAYVITKYKGTSLQECLYDKNKNNPLKIENVFSILDVFMKLGILYRGFLPRNTIVIGNEIFLLDWEDVVFCKEPKEKFVNMLWETNFLLNWSYLFDINDLKERIVKYKSQSPEPPLIKYERKFSEWINWKQSDKELRNKIMNTVLSAEKKLTISCDDEFCIMPNDLAHLISDLFNTDIDVIFDISCEILRSKNENQYYSLIKTLSNLIIKLYIQKRHIQPYAIILVLAIIEEAVTNKSIFNEQCQQIEQFFIEIKETNYDLVNAYLSESEQLFATKLNNYLNRLVQQYNNSSEEQLKTTILEKYILSFKSIK